MDNLFDINVNLIVIVASISTVAVTIASYAALRLILEKPPARFHVQVPPEAKPDWKATTTISNPSIRDPNDPTVIICYDPATGKYLSTVKAHTAVDVTEAISRARIAQKSWEKTSFAERKRVLNSLLNYIIEYQEEICWVTCRDSGKTMVDAMLGEILSTCERIRWTIKNGEKALATEFFDPGPLLPYKIAKIEYQPLGVVAALVSWNYPFHNLFGQIISALFAGNGILVKASEQVAWSVDYFSRIMKTCLNACGHDPEIVQFLCGYADCGEAIVRSGVDGITFVGSPQVGKQVMKTASDSLTPCILELGGKDAAILREDANLDQAIPIIMRGTFQNTGQNCVGIERVLVHEKLYDEFVRRVKEKITGDKLRVGCSLEEGEGKVDVGALTMSGQASRLENLINDSVSQGAKLVIGGKSYTHPIYPSGQYFTPTLLVDVTPSMPISQHEVFAPIMTVMKFQTDEEAIEMCNGCPYGLGNSVFTRDQAKGNQMAKRLKSGMVNVNDFAVAYICNLPFGGVGISGFGRFGGREGLRAMCLAKSVTLDRFPLIVKTTIPTVVDYPMHARGTTFVENLVRVIYKNDILERIKGGLALAREFMGR
ncbi:2488_t:CDS:2 [Paraglomus brasilianum]|uniref:2488_t:CDS:1 n=1 Tax=Paraglomus brasilianum TaxID=144538 RepID=A0A9N9G3R2_9GLOM|nr:2488_t:CDS:2 [Paraglomus brasilianum]